MCLSPILWCWVDKLVMWWWCRRIRVLVVALLDQDAFRWWFRWWDASTWQWCPFLGCQTCSILLNKFFIYLKKDNVKKHTWGSRDALHLEPLPISLPQPIHPDGVCTGDVVEVRWCGWGVLMWLRCGNWPNAKKKNPHIAFASKRRWLSI